MSSITCSKSISSEATLPARYGVEHECVVRVGTVAQFHNLFFHFRLLLDFVYDGSA